MNEPAEVEIGRESLIGFAANISDKFVGLLVFVFFANYFPPAEFGAAYVVIGGATILKTVVDGVSSALRKRISEDLSKRAAFAAVGVTALLGYVILISILYLIVSALIDLPYNSLVPAGILFIGGRAVNNMVKNIYSGVGSPGFSRVVDVTDGILTAILKLAFVLVFGTGTAGLIYGPAISGLGVGVAFYVLKFDRLVVLPDVAHFRSVSDFAKWSSLSTVLETGYREAGTVLLGIFVGNATASVFKTAERLTVAGRMPAREIANSLAVHTSGEVAAGRELDVHRWLSVTPILAVPVFFGSAILGDEIMGTIYGAPYAGTGYVLFALTLIVMLDAIQQGLTALLGGLDRPDLNVRLQIVRTVAFLPILGLLTYWHDLIGLLIGYVVLTPLGTILLAMLARNQTRSRLLSATLIVRQVAAALVMAAIVAVFRSMLAVESIIHLGALVGAGGVAYCLSLILLDNEIRSFTVRVGSRVLPSLQSFR